MDIKLKSLAVIIVILMVIDLPMILKINKEMYSKNFDDINGLQPSNSWRQIVSAVICYACMALGIYFFVMNSGSLDSMSYYELAKRSALFGFIVYGIYNTTTLVTINQYKLETAVVDTIWGICAITLTALISKFVIGYFLYQGQGQGQGLGEEGEILMTNE